MDIFIKGDKRNGIDGPNSRFWAEMAFEFERLTKLYPTLNAFQKVYHGKTFEEIKGEWEITGPPVGVHTFKVLARRCAAHVGYKGGEYGAVQFWLDHMNGDHILRKSAQLRRDDIREARVQLGDGRVERFAGRQRKG